MDAAFLSRYASLVAGVGANVQHGQQVLMIAAPEAAPLVRAIAGAAFERGAKFVDTWYFDAHVKRIRAELAPEDSLEFVPSWYPKRLLELGAAHGCRISVTPNTAPGLMDGVDPARAGRDQLPALKAHYEVINGKTTNWCVVPWATQEWADVVHPELEPADRLDKLWEELAYTLRLDEDDPAQAWHDRGRQLGDAGAKLDAARFDAIHFEGPGTDLTVGLLPTSHFNGGLSQTIDGITHIANLPTEEVFTSPDPTRADGVVTATKPLDVGGTVVHGLRVRFEGGRAVEIDADEGADALRARCAKDDGASRLGELALVDREGRIGKTGTVFFNTLLDENAASHLAFGHAYATAVGDEDVPNINESSIHIDFMMGSEDVAVTGITGDGARVPVLRGGVWQL
jgi:aminopeptidase